MFMPRISFPTTIIAYNHEKCNPLYLFYNASFDLFFSVNYTILLEYKKLKSDISKIAKILEKQNLKKSEFVKLMDGLNDPFLVLIFCILSLRTKDETTYPAALRLFELGKTPKDFLNVSVEAVQKAIYPVGFYRNKAGQILEIARVLVGNYGEIVPDNVEELCKLKGVGRKTANLVVAKGYHKSAICVDVHVHRICNRLGYVKTKTPDETELELRKKLPVELWTEFNTLLVTFGQNICRPINPKCDKCLITEYCQDFSQKKD